MNSSKRVALTFLFGVVVFATAHTQAPLYYSNQNQYFLHGLAAGGLGDLRHDWLANTTDPTPVFSALVETSYRHLHPYAFHVYYAILLGLYFTALMRLIEHVVGALSGLQWLLAAILITGVHHAALRFLSVDFLGVDYPWFLQCGVANQYLLGPGLQPSTFGIFLLVSLYAFVADRPILAALFASMAVVMHTTYAPTAAMMVLGYTVVLGLERDWRTAILAAALALLLTAPVVVLQLRAFGPTSPGLFAEAQHVLVHVRIPHHALPEKWFDWIAGLQVAWIVAGLIAMRRTRVFFVLAIVFLISLAATCVQLAAKNDTLALLFPWRASALLVPVATAALIGRLLPAMRGGSARLRRAFLFTGVFLVWKLFIGGVFSYIVVFQGVFAYPTIIDEKRLLGFVATRREAGDVYLLPVKSPSLAAGRRGTASTTFTPPPTQDKERHLVAVDLQQFRLRTGAAVVVDFKSIPYKDVDVLEWRERMRATEWLYEQPDWDKPEVREVLARYGVTHVVATARNPPSGSNLELVHFDGAYRIYRVKK